MVIDAFMFFNELDTLMIRLEELQEIVDVFVLVESGHTFSGHVKPFFFDDNKDLFARHLPRIHHVKLSGLPPLVCDTEEQRFWLERFQRNAIMFGLIAINPTFDDVVLISDVDEIPSAGAVSNVLEQIAKDDIFIFKQTYFKYFLDMECPEVNGLDWLGTVAVNYSTFSRVLPHELRRERARAGETFDSERHPGSGRRFIEAGGWHLTYFGGADSFQYKIANFAHGAEDSLGASARATAEVAPAVISQRSLKGLKHLDDEYLHALRRHILQSGLREKIPTIILTNLEKYYHLFRYSFTQSPLHWLG